MKGDAPGHDDWTTLAWLDASLAWARLRSRTRLEGLLGLVRTEILFDAALSENPPGIRNLKPADALALDPDRGV